MRKLIPLVFVLYSGISLAQDFTAQANLGNVPESGFYRIELQPSLSSWLNEGFTNFRIVDENGTHAPYIIEAAVDFETNEFGQYPVVENTLVEKCCTKLVIGNPDLKPISNIHLRIKNADVYKRASLSGSDDLKIWYALKDRFYLDAVNNPDNVSELRVLDFPLSNYKYYSLQIDDSTSAPLNIIAVGYYKSVVRKASYVPVNIQVVEVVNNTKTKMSDVTIKLDTSYFIDKVRIRAEGPPFFFRNASITYFAGETTAKGKTTQVFNFLGDGELSHEKDAVLDVDNIKTNLLKIKVGNEDNEPLAHFNISLFQTKRYAIAWMEKEKQYRLKIGNANMEQPVYDIRHFKNKLPLNMLSIVHGTVTPLTKKENAPKEELLATRYLVWGGIIGTMIILGIMSFRLIRETKASGE